MKGKRIISGLLALTFVFGGIVVPSNVVNNSSIISASAGSGDFIYSLLNDGTYEIYDISTNLRNNVIHAVIPSEFNGKEVTSISKSVFNQCNFTSVEIPNTITKISYNSFYGCENLKSIVLPESITEIEDCAFQNCKSLESVTLNEGLEKIGAKAFQDCESLKSIEIPSSVGRIGDFAFYNYNSKYPTLAELHISGGGTQLKIGQWAFVGCSGLKDINIPDRVVDIGNYAFEYCTGLESISLPDSLKDLGYCAFMGCSNLKNVNIPKSLKAIPQSTFSDCTNLTNIKIPDNITKIESCAFIRCTGLTNITIPDNLTKIESSAFSYCNNLTSVVIPASVTEIGDDAFNNKTYYSDPNDPNRSKKKSLTIYCYPGTAAEKYAKAHKDEGIKYQYLFPQNIKYKYSAQYRQLKLTWDKIEVADRYGIAAYIAGKWRMQTQDIPATFTSYITRKNSVFVGSTYKVAVAARVNGKWDTANAIKHAVTVKISGSKPNNEDDNIEDIPDPVEPVTINDNFLDDSGSISGNNPQTNDFQGINEYLNKTLKMRSSTIPVSSEDKNGPRKNELIFTRTRKKDKSDAIFNLAPSKNSDFAFTITDTEETKFGIACTTDDYKSTVRIYNTNDKNHVTPLDIKLSDVEYFNDGTKMSKKITYYFALEKDKKYEISVNNPTNNHEGDYEIHVSEDNWYHIPPDKGGIAYADWLVCQGLTAKDYTMIYLPESKVKELVSTMNWEKTSDPFFNEDFIHAMSDRFYVDKNILKDITAKLSNDFSIAATYAGVVLAFTFPEATAIGAIVTCFGGSATTINLVSSKEDSSKSLFESSLEEATKDGKYDLCLSRYSYISNVPTYGTCLEWCSWNEEYLYKYIDGDTPIYFKPGIDVDNVNMYQYKEE